MDELTPGEWICGIRKDGSMWLSLGNPEIGPHYQGDLCASKADALAIVSAKAMLELLIESGGGTNADWCERRDRLVRDATLVVRS